VEPVNGQIKEARGLRCFLLRGLEKVGRSQQQGAGHGNLMKGPWPWKLNQGEPATIIEHCSQVIQLWQFG
jgi:hypothetical protein